MDTPNFDNNIATYLFPLDLISSLSLFPGLTLCSLNFCIISAVPASSILAFSKLLSYEAQVTFDAYNHLDSQTCTQLSL